MMIDNVECTLLDDGTTDTVIETTIDGIIDETRLSTDCASIYRDENGMFTDMMFQELCENEVVPFLEY